jgi:anti-sigma regulatory factor (Ser/Thr protein kinase)
MRVRTRGELVRKFILQEVGAHPRDIARITAERFGITRQAVNKHLTNLVKEGVLVVEGQTRQTVYKLCSAANWTRSYKLEPGLAEDTVWREDIAPHLGQLPENVMSIWHLGFTEMFNNAIDHSGGTLITVQVQKTADYADMWVLDNGVGIFRKIQNALGLTDERHAVLELSKGKLTTDPARHSGEGIFFTSRMFDRFVILSGGTHFSHNFGEAEDWILEMKTPLDSATGVYMDLQNHTARTTRQIYREYSSGDDFGFSKTVVPVRLAQYGDDLLISRSQAKRLLARVDRFRTVLFDFEGVSAIGQSFADEIFRVFRSQHPNMELYGINAATEVQEMINRALIADIGLSELPRTKPVEPDDGTR